MSDVQELQPGSSSPFERIRRYDDAGVEYWSSRELTEILGYEDYRNFLSVLEKARISCENSGISTQDHFVDATDMIVVVRARNVKSK